MTNRDLKRTPPDDLKGPQRQAWFGQKPMEVEMNGKKLAGDDVVIERIGEKIPAPGPSRYNTVYFQGIKEVIQSLNGNIPVLPFIMTGATDMRYFRDLGIPSYGFFPVTLTKEEHMTMHSKDERISLANIKEGLDGCRAVVDFLASDRIP